MAFTTWKWSDCHEFHESIVQLTRKKGWARIWSAVSRSWQSTHESSSKQTFLRMSLWRYFRSSYAFLRCSLPVPLPLNRHYPLSNPKRQQMKRKRVPSVQQVVESTQIKKNDHSQRWRLKTNQKERETPRKIKKVWSSLFPQTFSPPKGPHQSAPVRASGSQMRPLSKSRAWNPV